MPFNLTFPHTDGANRSISLEVGQVLFMLGANGAGKSSLIHRFFIDNSSISRRITAHRQTWFASNTIDMTALGKRNTEVNITNSDKRADSRWKDDYSAQRSSVTIFDIIDSENIRSREIASAVDANDIDKAVEVSKTEAPIKVINDLLKQANLPIEINIQRGEEITATKNSGAPYSIAQLSDGERNALLIAASVLTASAGSLILVDEPERHLHRSIISPLLSLLFAKRPDCAFIVSTHDIGLPLDNRKAQTLLVRACAYQGAAVTSWDAELVPADNGIDEDVKADIIGSRKKIVFVEGKSRSLDYALYSIVFPEVSIIPKESCREVEHFVGSIRGSAALHWLAAWGIVDNDRRTPDDIARLTRMGVYPIENHSVESIYYHPEIVKRIAVRHAQLTGGDPNVMCSAAIDAAIQSIAPHKERLSSRVSENEVRAAVFKNLPTSRSVQERTPIRVDIDVAEIVRTEAEFFERAVQEKDVLFLIGRYPVRETPALGAIVGRLGFKDERTYESSVRKMISDDPNALSFVRNLFGAFISDIQSHSGTTAVTLP